MAAKSPQDSPPKFVNLQTGSVTVFDENKKSLTVNPFVLRNRQDGTYVVEGEHYRKFVAPYGPLSPFPVEIPAAHPVAVVAPPKPPPPPRQTSAPSQSTIEDADPETIAEVTKIIELSGLALDVDDRTEILEYVIRNRRGEKFILDEPFAVMKGELDKLIDKKKNAPAARKR